MIIWKLFLIFFLGCMVGSFVSMIILALCNAAASADERMEKMALEKFEREKKKENSSLLKADG